MSEKEIKIEDFYKKYFNSNEERVKVTLDDIQGLKKEGISAEQFLDYLCQKKGLLLHGSIQQVDSGKLTAKRDKIFATNKAAIAIMRSLYSNSGVNLEYKYFLSDENPLTLEIHTQPDGKFTKRDIGFVYIVSSDGFRNDPKDSWQFVRDIEEVDWIGVIETENDDFTYPIKIFNDYDPKK